MIQAPRELLRKGRWDELFFVDLPNETERQAIWQMVIRRCDCDPNEFDTAQFATALAGPTGSEIEQASVKLLDQAFDEETERTDLTIATMVNDLDKLGEEELICVRVQVLAHSVLRPANQTRNSPRRVPSSTAFSRFVCKPLMHF